MIYDEKLYLQDATHVYWLKTILRHRLVIVVDYYSVLIITKSTTFRYFTQHMPVQLLVTFLNME